jgi:hypothetical protein
MILERYPEIETLSVEELLLLSDEIQDKAWRLKESPERDAAIAERLEERHQEYLADPSKGMTLDEFWTSYHRHMDAYRKARK